MSDDVRWSNVFTSYGSGIAVAVYFSVSDGVVSGVHVDTGVDSAFPSDTENTVCAEQSFRSGHLYDDCGNCHFYCADLHKECGCFWIDEITGQVFWVFNCCSPVVYASDYGSENRLPEEIS